MQLQIIAFVPSLFLQLLDAYFDKLQQIVDALIPFLLRKFALLRYKLITVTFKDKINLFVIYKLDKIKIFDGGVFLPI